MHRLIRAILCDVAMTVLPVMASFVPGFAASPAVVHRPVQSVATQRQIPIVLGIHLQELPSQSRIVLEFSDPVIVRTFLLSDPDRLVVEMPQVMWRPSDTPSPSGRSLVRDYRFGLFRKDSSRLMLELNRPVKIEKSEILPPKDGAGFLFVLDLAATSQSDFTAHSGWPQDDGPAIRDVAAHETGIRSGKTRPLIVLDPGHGGFDPGTHGETGLVEKDVSLAVAKALQERLELSGHYRVKLTRDSDVFIALRDRVSMARAAHGDLFVSLHADSNEHREIRGASVYTLSPGATDRETANLANKENHSGVALGLEAPEINPVADSILSDLGGREIMNLSVRFAGTIIATLPGATAVHSPLPHRSADFAVLKAPDIPSVLIELGYLTNHDDETAMATAAWRSRVAVALSAAIDRHFSESPVFQAEAQAFPSPLSGHIRGVRTNGGLSSPAQELTQ